MEPRVPHRDQPLTQTVVPRAEIGTRHGSTVMARNAVFSRGLRYTLLLCYGGTVAILVVAVGGLIGNEHPRPWWLFALALLVVVVTLPAIHTWLRLHIDRFVYDWHDNPYAVLSEVSQHLEREQERSPGAIVGTMAATIAATLRLPYVTITTTLNGAAHMTAHGTPPPGAAIVELPLAYQGMAIGVLRAAARRPDGVLSTDDLRLLHDLARQVGIALHATRLSDELQASREALIAAREEERRRIRRDLHDSLGPTLAALRMQLGAVRRTLREEPTTAEAQIDELRDDVRAATAEIRRLVYDLRPPLLDEHGLDGALRSLSAVVAPATLTLELPAPLPTFSAALEVALYRIAAEAVHNVARHAGAATCLVRLTTEPDAVLLTIRDDGVGLPDEHGGGIGLTSMRERAAELGGTLSIAAAPDGGTCVGAHIPWRRPA